MRTESAHGAERTRWRASRRQAGRAGGAPAPEGADLGRGQNTRDARMARGLRNRPGSRARRVGRGGGALPASDDLTLGADRGTRGRRGPGRPAVEGDEPRADRERGKKSARKPSPGTCPRWRAARRGALPGLPRAPGQVGRVWGRGRGGLFPLAHPPPPRLGQREGASKQGIGARISDRVTLFPVRTHHCRSAEVQGH